MFNWARGSFRRKKKDKESGKSDQHNSQIDESTGNNLSLEKKLQPCEEHRVGTGEEIESHTVNATSKLAKSNKEKINFVDEDKVKNKSGKVKKSKTKDKSSKTPKKEKLKKKNSLSCTKGNTLEAPYTKAISQGNKESAIRKKSRNPFNLLSSKRSSKQSITSLSNCDDATNVLSETTDSKACHALQDTQTNVTVHVAIDRCTPDTSDNKTYKVENRRSHENAKETHEEIKSSNNGAIETKTDKNIIYKQNGKLIHEIGGDSGNEVIVSFSKDFNDVKNNSVEVIEEPCIRKNFTPLMPDEIGNTGTDSENHSSLGEINQFHKINENDNQERNTQAKSKQATMTSSKPQRDAERETPLLDPKLLQSTKENYLTKDSTDPNVPADLLKNKSSTTNIICSQNELSNKSIPSPVDIVKQSTNKTSKSELEDIIEQLNLQEAINGINSFDPRIDQSNSRTISDDVMPQNNADNSRNTEGIINSHDYTGNMQLQSQLNIENTQCNKNILKKNNITVEPSSSTPPTESSNAIQITDASSNNHTCSTSRTDTVNIQDTNKVKSLSTSPSSSTATAGRDQFPSSVVGRTAPGDGDETYPSQAIIPHSNSSSRDFADKAYAISSKTTPIERSDTEHGKLDSVTSNVSDEHITKTRSNWDWADSIISSDNISPSDISDKNILYKQNGKLIHEIGGDSGNEVIVSFSKDFNDAKNNTVEVIEEPCLIKNFTPLMPDEIGNTAGNNSKVVENRQNSEKYSYNSEQCNTKDKSSSSLKSNLLKEIPATQIDDATTCHVLKTEAVIDSKCISSNQKDNTINNENILKCGDKNVAFDGKLASEPQGDDIASSITDDFGPILAEFDDLLEDLKSVKSWTVDYSEPEPLLNEVTKVAETKNTVIQDFQYSHKDESLNVLRVLQSIKQAALNSEHKTIDIDRDNKSYSNIEDVSTDTKASQKIDSSSSETKVKVTINSGVEEVNTTSSILLTSEPTEKEAQASLSPQLKEDIPDPRVRPDISESTKGDESRDMDNGSGKNPRLGERSVHFSNSPYSTVNRTKECYTIVEEVGSPTKNVDTSAIGATKISDNSSSYNSSCNNTQNNSSNSNNINHINGYRSVTINSSNSVADSTENKNSSHSDDQNKRKNIAAIDQVLRVTLAEEEEFDDIDIEVTTETAEGNVVSRGGVSDKDTTVESAEIKVNSGKEGTFDTIISSPRMIKHQDDDITSNGYEDSNASVTQAKRDSTDMGSVISCDAICSASTKTIEKDEGVNKSDPFQGKKSTFRGDSIPVVIPKIELQIVEEKEIFVSPSSSPKYKTTGIRRSSDSPEVVPPVKITITAATPVKTAKPQLPVKPLLPKDGRRRNSSTSSNGTSSDSDDINESINVKKVKPKKKSDEISFADESSGHEEIISIELQKQISIEENNKINISLNKCDLVKSESSSNITEKKENKPVNIKKEIEKLNKRLELNRAILTKNSADKTSPKSQTITIDTTSHQPTVQDVINGNVASDKVCHINNSNNSQKQEEKHDTENEQAEHVESSSIQPIQNDNNSSNITTEHLAKPISRSPSPSSNCKDNHTIKVTTKISSISDENYHEERIEKKNDDAPEKDDTAAGQILKAEDPEQIAASPVQVHPSTESYLNPCKELLESSQAPVIETSSTEAADFSKIQNPFDEFEEDEAYEESDEEPITVIHSTPKNTPKAAATANSTNPFDDEDGDEDDQEIIESLSSSDSINATRTVPSPLPRTSLKASIPTPPVPTPRKTKISPSGSMQSINSISASNYPTNDDSSHDLRSHLNVSVMSTKSLNPFEISEEEEEEDCNRAFKSTKKNKIGGSQCSLRGDSTTGDFSRNGYRGSLPLRRKKRRAPLPPGMQQAPSPSPAHAPISSMTSSPLPPSGGGHNKGNTGGLKPYSIAQRRGTWGNSSVSSSSSPRKRVPPPRPPPPSLTVPTLPTAHNMKHILEKELYTV